MKKLTISFLIFFGLIICCTGIIPVHADDVIPYDNQPTITPQISENNKTLISEGELFLEYLRHGGQVDFSNSNSSTTAEEFLDSLGDVFSNVMDYTVDIYNWAQPLDILDIPTGKYKYTPQNMRDISVFMKKLPSYLNEQENTLPPEPSPEQDYLNYLDTINNYHYGYGFWWKEKPIQTISNMLSQGYTGFFAPRNDFTNYGNFSYYSNLDIVSNYESSQSFCAYMPITININSIDNIYYVTYETVTPVQMFCYYTYGNQYPKYLGFYYYNASKSQYRANGNSSTSSDSPLSLPNNISGTLNYCLNYISLHFRNVNIYVNGIPWALVFQETIYNIGLSDGTYLEGTNLPVAYDLTVNNSTDVQLYIDLNDLLDKIEYSIQNNLTVDFPDFSYLITDVNGQSCVAVTIIEEDLTIDDQYIKEYGPMIPIFPLWVNYPVDLHDVTTVATVGLIDVIPDDILELLGVFFIGTLCICMIHRLLE